MEGWGTMDYKKIIERWLSEYEGVKLTIEADWTLLQESRINIGSGIDTTREATGKTNKFNSEVENKVLEFERIEERLDKNIRKIKMLNDALDKIGYTERRVLELRYIKGYRWNDISKEMNYDYSWCQRLRVKGINQMEKLLFPETVHKNP
jgi:DNA-directed RNA polymerase specialized sigma subunit